MNFEEFSQELAEQIESALADKNMAVNITTQHVEKLNGDYNAITVTPEGSNIGVSLNADVLYDAYEQNYGMEKLVDRAVEQIEIAIADQPQVAVEAITDYEKMKSTLVMEVVSTETNAQMLEHLPHKELEDMSIVYRFLISSDNEGRASVVINNNMMEQMGITPEQLHEDAMKNSPVIRPAVIQNMAEVMMELNHLTPEEADMMGLTMDDGPQMMYVATVPDKINGAGVLAYQDFMEQASERIGGGDFYILPSSKHEVLIVPDKDFVQLDDLKAMVKEVNATEVSAQDKLTDSVYHYDSQDKVFELADKFEQRVAEKEQTRDKKSIIAELKEKKEQIASQPKKAAEKAIKSKGEISL